ncbi:MAG: SRPBCC family protein [Pseudomonadota bacterium]
MRILIWLLAIAGGLVVTAAVVIFAGGYLLPREVTVARSIEINAAPEEVFPHVNSLKAMEAWSPWLSRDPDVKLTYNDVEQGSGATMEWASEQPDVGSGRQEITASTPNESVETALDFGEMGLAKAQFLLAPADGATTVTWTLETDMGGGPVGRWMGLMMDGWVGADYEQGLENLKTLVEE